jgi:diguanylate cyclase (GGDEF)-like protein
LLTSLRGLSGFLVPLVVLLAAHLLAPRDLPFTLTGLRTWGPVMLLALAAALALIFNRGRVLFAVVSLSAAFIAYKLFLTRSADEFTWRTVFVALCLFVPLNLAVLSVLRERGVFTLYGMRRLGAIVLQISVTAWVISQGRTEITEWLYRPMFDPVWMSTPVAHLALVLMLLGVATTVADAVVNRSPIEAAFAGALLAFAVGCDEIARPNHFAVYTAAAAIILAAGVLHDSFRLAFRDELTGLPSRRALNERLMSLGGSYTMAMLDVDHFKSFNDRYGHDLGDHVLKMVATRLQHTGGGGRAYRYGGEEFTILFAGRRMRDAWPHLEALRKDIAAYPMVIRGADRPHEAPARRRQQGAQSGEDKVTVTVSIGVAERDNRYTTPGQVLRAADRALYRAKEKGRNRLSW